MGGELHRCTTTSLEIRPLPWRRSPTTLELAQAADTATATASTTTTGNTSQQGDHKGAALLAGLRPLKQEAGAGAGEQEEVLSSLTPAGSSAAAEAARNAAATPGPDQGDVTSGLQHCYGGGFAVADMAHLDDGTFDLDDLVGFGFDQGQDEF